MKSIKIFGIGFFLISFQFSIYADCRLFSIGEARYINYETSEVIFLGIPIKIEDNFYEFIVIEKYKGKIDKKVNVFFKNYVSEEDVFSLWLVYGNKPLDNDTVYVDECSLSRSINNLGGLYRKSIPPPKLMTENNVEENVFLNNYLVKIQYRNDFYDEIEILRGLKTFSIIENEKLEYKFYHQYITSIFILSLLLLICTLLLIILWKLRKS